LASFQCTGETPMDMMAPDIANPALEGYCRKMAPRTKVRLCRKCRNQIPPSAFIDGKVRRLWIRKYCLVCSPWGAGNSKKLELVRTDGLKKCSSCRALSPAQSFKRNGICKPCQARKARSERADAKRRSVEFLGGRCIKCGYKACLAALDFHHRDPKKKDFQIGSRREMAFARLKKELRKCDLLCRNCHAEVHFLREVAETGPALPRVRRAG
jgi:hypothetical protein